MADFLRYVRNTFNPFYHDPVLSKREHLMFCCLNWACVFAGIAIGSDLLDGWL